MTLTAEHIYLLQVVKCVVGERSAIYLSGPITTGRRFLDWYISTGHTIAIDSKAYQHNIYEHVVSKNELDLIETANKLRNNSAMTVIEPASLHIPTWGQRDYYLFWTELIRRFVTKMVALDGWQYSIGCVIEFHHAIQAGIPVETIDGKPMNEENANKLILAAAEEILLRGSSFELLNRMAQRLKSQELLNGETGA